MKKRTLILLFTAILALLTAAGCGNSKQSRYEAAQKLLKEERYREAAERFDELGDFSDSAKYSMYARALEAAEDGEFKDAEATMESLGDFADAGFYKIYFKAAQLKKEGGYVKLLEAKELYESIPLFKDSKRKIREIEDLIAKENEDSGTEQNEDPGTDENEDPGTEKNEDPGSEENGAPGTEGSEDPVENSQQSQYEAAQELLKEGKYKEASELFDQLGDFSDSAKYSMYAKALAAAEDGNYKDAIATMKSLGDFADAGFYSIYFEAEQLKAEGDYKKLLEARELYESIPLFKDSKSKIEEIDALIAGMNADKSPFAFAEKGELVEFGRYEQDGDLSNGPEPILWRVLSKEQGKTLVISEYCLDNKPYHEVLEKPISWEMCTLREWLNGEFYQAAFTEDEQSFILLTHVVNEDTNYSDPVHGVGGHIDTEDKVFLLSRNEMDRYFTDDDSKLVFPTQYVKDMGASLSSDGSGDWWLRNVNGHYPACFGYFMGIGFIPANHFEVVRPVIVVSDKGAERLELKASGEYDSRLDAAFASGEVSLTPVKGIDKTALKLEISDECLEVLQGIMSEEGYSSKEEVREYLQEGFEESVVACISPEGSHALLKVVGREGPGAVFSVDGNIVYPLFPSAKKGVEDIYQNLQRFYKEGINVVPEPEGITWSHNGQYAVFPRCRILREGGSMALANPVVLDIETGELFLTETFVSKSARLEGFGYMVSAVFSTDDRYLYYTVYANDGKGLHRYDFQTGNAEECYIGDERYDFEPIYFLSNGAIMTSKERHNDPTGGILYYSETDGKWAARIESFRWEYAFRGVKLYQREGSDHLIVSGKNIDGGFDGTPMPAFLSFYKTKEEIKDDGRYRCIDVDSGQIVEPEGDYLKAYEHAVQNVFMSDAPDLNSDEAKKVSRTHYATWISAISMSPDGNYALVLYYGMDREYNHVHKLVLIRLEDQKSVEVTGLNMDNLNYGGDAWKHYAPIIGWEGEYIFVSETSGIHYYTINE